MKSITALNGVHDAQVEAKLFEVPSFTPDQALIPFARVNHNKYMVTDKTGFIGKHTYNKNVYFHNFPFHPVESKYQFMKTCYLLH